MDSHVIAAVTVPIALFSVPIIWILSIHQRKMAEIIHGSKAASNQAEIAALQQQMEELRQVVGQQTFAVEDLRSRVALPSTALSQRSGD